MTARRRAADVGRQFLRAEVRGLTPDALLLWESPRY